VNTQRSRSSSQRLPLGIEPGIAIPFRNAPTEIPDLSAQRKLESTLPPDLASYQFTVLIPQGRWIETETSSARSLEQELGVMVTCPVGSDSCNASE
jgi:hypothetical protein